MVCFYTLSTILMSLSDAPMIDKMANGQPSKQVDRDNEYTSQVLLRLGFRWSEPDSDYVGKMLMAISQLGFFEV